MYVTVKPTEEITTIKLDGVEVKARVWQGITEKGVGVQLYIVSMTPNHDADREALAAEVPAFMKPSRTVYAVGDNPKEEA